MQGNHYLSKHQFLVILLLCVLSLTILSGNYIQKVENLLQEQTKIMLGEVTVQGAQCIGERLNEEFIVLESLINGLIKNSKLDGIDKFERLKCIQEISNLRTVGIASLDGELFLADGSRYDISSTEYFQIAKKGERNISHRIRSDRDEEAIVIYTIPLLTKGEVESVFMATYKPEQLLDEIMVDFFQGEGAIYVLDDNEKIQYSSGPLSVEFVEGHKKWHEMHDKRPINGDLTTQMCEDYLEDIGGNYYAMERIQNKEGWSLLYIVPERVVANNDRMVIQEMGQVAMWITLFFTAAIAYILIIGDKNKKQIYKMAYVSSETGIYNRNRFIEAAKEKITKSKKQYALIYFDVDNFRVYHEIFGEKFSLLLIQKIAGKLRKYLKYEGVLYAHLGQDHFAILLPYGEKENIVRMVGILERKLEKIQIEGYPYIHIILSTGIYIIPKESQDIIGALNKASLARQRVKGHHDIRHRFFDEKESQMLKEDTQLEAEILSALENDEFSVYYQPKFNTQTGQLAGAEALVRWNHPTQGMISPARFIPVAESNGSIVEITYFVLKQVCEDIKTWQDEGIDIVPISINFSQVEMYHPNILEYIKECLIQYGIEAKWLEIEITERVAIEDLRLAKKMMLAFRKLGLKVSMDDFGTGYAGPGYIKSLPFDIIKIDKSLIDDIDTDNKSKQLLLGLVNVLKSLGLTIVAEGVENTRQAQCIQDMGVDYIQGYVFAKPLTKQEFEWKLIKS